MAKFTEKDRELLELVREHKDKEKEFLDRLNDHKVMPINEETLLSPISQNYGLGDRIRKLLSESEPPTFRDPSVLKHLKKIRNQKSETDKLYVRSICYNLLANRIRPDEDISKKLNEIEEEKHKQIESTLDEMISYFMEWAGDSLTFSDRKKEFGTLLVARPLPPKIEPYLRYIKHCYLLNMNEAVIGLSRVLIEVACQSIYDKLPEKDKSKIQHIDREVSCRDMIRKACQHRLTSQQKNTKEIQSIKEKAVDLYGKASKILHGKSPNSKTDEVTLGFVRDVFFVIEALY
ncbi:MAG: hypothetical protein L6263_01615 [Desulfobacteraceae bacterium]|nr:hypothetical protein [Desulfobacteraceae bacterium]